MDSQKPVDLEAIKARLEAITPGQWIADGSVVKHAQGFFWWTLSDQVDESHNAEFIAHAPEDVRALVAEVERLTEAENTARQMLIKALERLSEFIREQSYD